jgi:hypothetical protein
LKVNDKKLNARLVAIALELSEILESGQAFGNEYNRLVGERIGLRAVLRGKYS